MERCATTDRMLTCCSNIVPSMSGGLQGAPGLANKVEHRVPAHIRGLVVKRARKREWVGASQLHDRLGRQDENRQVRRSADGRCMKLQACFEHCEELPTLIICVIMRLLLGSQH